MSLPKESGNGRRSMFPNHCITYFKIYKFYKIFILYSASVSFFEQVIELLKKKKNPQDLYMINGNKAGIIVFVFFFSGMGEPSQIRLRDWVLLVIGVESASLLMSN